MQTPTNWDIDSEESGLAWELGQTATMQSFLSKGAGTKIDSHLKLSRKEESLFRVCDGQQLRQPATSCLMKYASHDEVPCVSALSITSISLNL